VTSYETMNDLRRKILTNIPGVRIGVRPAPARHDRRYGRQSRVRWKLNFSATTCRSSENLADEIGPKLRQVPASWISKASSKVTRRSSSTWIGASGTRGLTVDQVSQQVGAGLLGRTQTELRKADRTIGIRVRFPDSFRYNYDDVRQFPIVTPAKQIVPVSALAEIDQAAR